jgi:beta-lactamase regulating signal transducer with metallopeptidase domain
MTAELCERLVPLLATYLIHSTCLIGALALVFWVRPPRSAQLRQLAWKLAMALGLVTVPLQAGMTIEPLSGQVTLQRPLWDGLPRPSTEGDGLGRPSYRHHDLGVPSYEKDGLGRRFKGDLSDSQSVARSLGERKADGEASARPKSGLQVGVAEDVARNSFRGPRPQSQSPPSEFRATRAVPWHAAVGVAWLAGVLFCALRVAIGWLRLGGSRALVEVRRGPERRALDDLCRQAGLKREVRLYRTTDGASPIAWGLVRWHVALPAPLTKRLNHRELRALLAHELAHLVRGDTRWLWLASVIGSLGFFQPLNRLAQRKIRHEAELLSDRWAVLRTGDRLALASSLTAVAELLLGPAAALAAGATTTCSSLRERLDFLLDERPLGPARSSAGAKSLAAALGVAVALAVVTLLPAVKLPADTVETTVETTNDSLSPSPSTGADEPLDRLWHEFDLLDYELRLLELALAKAEQSDTRSAAERIRLRWSTLRARRDELRNESQLIPFSSAIGATR